MITGPAYFLRPGGRPYEKYLGAIYARQIVILASYLNRLYTRTGIKRYQVTFEDLHLTPVSDVRNDINAHPHDVYLVSHGAVFVNGSQYPYDHFNWHQFPHGVEEIQAFQGEMHPLAEFGSNLDPNNVFGCYLSPGVRKVKLYWYSDPISRIDSYEHMYISVFKRLSRYFTNPEEPCTRIVKIYEGEIGDSEYNSTKAALKQHFLPEEDFDYGEKQAEIDELWGGLFDEP